MRREDGDARGPGRDLLVGFAAQRLVPRPVQAVRVQPEHGALEQRQAGRATRMALAHAILEPPPREVPRLRPRVWKPSLTTL